MTALARLDDPATSHEAAATVDVTATQCGILSVLATADRPYTDDDIYAAYYSVWDVYDWPNATPQSIRSRRAELARKGLVVQAGYGITNNGRKCRTWVTV